MTPDELRVELQRLKALLGPATIPWGVAAGAGVHLYTQKRQPTDLDLLVPPKDLEAVARLMNTSVKTEAGAWGEAKKVVQGETEVVGSLLVRVDGGAFLYQMDGPMADHIRSVSFKGIQVPVLSPEDLLALKAVMQRELSQGKHDLEDIAVLVAAVPIDVAYLQDRLRRMDATDRALPILRQYRLLG